MLIGLALKEMRETIWIAAAALAVYLCFVVTATGVDLGLGMSFGRDEAIPFLSEDWVVSFAVVATCLAAGLGLWQTVGESARGTYQFLLHRPASRNRLIGTKLVVGSSLYLVCSAVPVLVYAWWAATPGNHPNPFEWWMTAMTWKVWMATTIVYLGAFLTGIRPGRWYGTRLLPLVAAAALAIVIALLPQWWLTGLPIMVILDVLLVRNILFVARTRDFS